jgi:hypothetical protein
MEHEAQLGAAAPPLRVDVAPVGFYVDRVVEPIRVHNADRVYLIRARSEPDDRAAPFRNQVLRELKRWKRNIDVRVIGTDLWELESAIETFSAIVRKEREAGNHVWVNLSTGTKLEAVAAALACMAHDATPYYVQMTSYERRDPSTPLAEGVKAITAVATYGLSSPSPAGLALLSLLEENPLGLAKKDLLSGLTDAGFLPPDSPDRTVQARYARLQVALDPLLTPPPLASVRGSRRATRIQITNRGRLALRLFAPRAGLAAATVFGS